MEKFIQNTWHKCKNILIIRPDNMGDIIMMTPALRALKQTFGCKITLLTSRKGSLITPYINDIDETLVYDLPWVKTDQPITPEASIELVKKLKDLHFDGAIISTVYSQNPLPAALIAFMAGIPLRHAYCRENPYDLLTHCIPDKEPYSFVQHQVTRELNLVAYIGARTDDVRLTLEFKEAAYYTAVEKLLSAGVDINKSWLIIHPGVSETKREYPVSLWIKTAMRLYQQTGNQILITGAANEKQLADTIQQSAGEGIFSVAGLFNIEEFMALIANAKLVISVNTATVHIAAAANTPVIVLYALTNTQHTPWEVPTVVLPFSVPRNLQSKNEVIRYVHRKYGEKVITYPSPAKIIKSVLWLLKHARKEESLLQQQ